MPRLTVIFVLLQRSSVSHFVPRTVAAPWRPLVRKRPLPSPHRRRTFFFFADADAFLALPQLSVAVERQLRDRLAAPGLRDHELRPCRSRRSGRPAARSRRRRQPHAALRRVDRAAERDRLVGAERAELAVLEPDPDRAADLAGHDGLAQLRLPGWLAAASDLLSRRAAAAARRRVKVTGALVPTLPAVVGLARHEPCRCRARAAGASTDHAVPLRVAVSVWTGVPAAAPPRRPARPGRGVARRVAGRAAERRRGVVRRGAG